MKILVVKLSSLGDVVHAMPAVQDMRAVYPGARIAWVVERAFAPLVERVRGVDLAIPCELRRWMRAPFSASTRAAWRGFRTALRADTYDAVIDLQGLTKSALIARAARTAPGGLRYALGNRTEGAGWEPPTRWVADVAVRIAPHVHAVRRSRELCAQALGYAVPQGQSFGLRAHGGADVPPNTVALVHGTSRGDKCWPQDHWIALGRRLVAQGFRPGLPHGSDAERERSDAIARALGPQADVWPRLELGALADRLAGCAGVIGVDSGLSHIAVALDLPHVQIYNFDTAWRTGPEAAARQCSVTGKPTPGVDAVWDAFQRMVVPR